ncbi:MAG: tetraacyldisaccharide 4'-kinase [Pirellulales bacterium]
MLSPSEFRDLVSGRRRGLSASLLRAGLRLAETPYACAMRLRNWRYDTGRAEIVRADVPVVSVGNLTLGGTGKTPLVVWLARWFRDRDVRVSLISRGYGAAANRRNDEALELEHRLPDVPHLLDRDRAAAAQVAEEELDTQLILLDDAFQHRRMHRDLDIVLLDALDPFGAEHVFPRGLMREPPTGLHRAHIIGLSRANALNDSQRAAIRQRAKRYAPHAAWFEASHAPQGLLSSSGRGESLAALAGQRVAAFCGLGNPAGFRLTLEHLKSELVELREFPDHHPYTRDDVRGLSDWAGQLHVAAVLTTHKDLVKLELDQIGRAPLWAVTIGMEILAGRDELEALLMPLLPANQSPA